ncbi:hypothetical protein TWF694_007646 [Orbilia ellipsospora]|uniref:Uncharacterized protein n=1 Tax=Orbilia ellipsospora TaxID=2528407 RepID=A0AAV9XIF2_9PEZI
MTTTLEMTPAGSSNTINECRTVSLHITLGKALQDQKNFKVSYGDFEGSKIVKDFEARYLKIGDWKLDELQPPSLSSSLKTRRSRTQQVDRIIELSSKWTTQASTYIELINWLVPLAAQEKACYEMAHKEWLYLKKETYATTELAILSLIDETLLLLEGPLQSTEPKIHDIIEDLSTIVNNFQEMFTISSSVAGANSQSEELEKVATGMISAPKIESRFEDATTIATTATIQDRWQKFQKSIEHFKIMWDIWCTFTNGLNELIKIKHLLELRRVPLNTPLKRSKTV